MRFREHIRSPQEWRRAFLGIRNWRNAARRYAAENGDSVAYLCDDSVIYFTRDHEGKIRQKTVRRELGALLARERALVENLAAGT